MVASVAATVAPEVHLVALGPADAATTIPSLGKYSTVISKQLEITPAFVGVVLYLFVNLFL